MLLHLEAPVKIVGTFLSTQVTYTASTTICSESSRSLVSLQQPTISSWETTLTEDNKESKPSVFSFATKLNTRRISSFLEETMNLNGSQNTTDSTINAKEDTPLNYGKYLRNVSIAYQ